MKNKMPYGLTNQYRWKYDLQLFAKEGPGGEKTEAATPKKLNDARKEGQVAKSMDLITGFMLLGMFLGIKIFVGYIGKRFLEDFSKYYGVIDEIANEDFTRNTTQSILQDGIIELLVIGLPLMLIAVVVAIAFNVAQVKWMVTAKPLKPKFSKFNPISGFKRMFSKDKIMELLKSIAKVGVLTYIVYDTLKDKYTLLFEFYFYNLASAVVSIGSIVIDLGIKISFCFLIIAVADYFYQKHKFNEDMKMTKQEIKDEYKNAEGDPQIKGKIKARMREASQRRMMQALPEADVVITNPTHLAVALKYDKESSSAPIVIAKGADYLARKIKEVARENHIEIVENKPLARMLYYNVEIEQEIPPELYQAVAEILAYVYGLKE